ncbi:MAG: Endonuclease IV [uncultured Truepera sp.]|uniref:Probable endonuclease 4 n=1 Tax=uncultured Truepera sp. TaxID=543023 RepID=A0A6J4V938_9DEIN|nr:MAG: Endonuclease IV [uncultured Truepera sp.]
MALLGAHVPTAGSVGRAFANAKAIGADSVQIFVKNPNRWGAGAFTEAELKAYGRERDRHGNPAVVAHASYLINLSATNPETLKRSRTALKDELTRCAQLGVGGLVLHPGAHLGAGIEAGLDAAARSLDLVLAEIETPVPVWLENTAGQGTVLGSRPQELAALIASCDQKVRLGVCLDTCHAFAAGYAVHTEAGLEEFLEAVETHIGSTRIGCFHLNDSLYPLGSRRDRHATLGLGEIGMAAFVWLAGDARFTNTPMLLETPVGDDKQEHARDLAHLREALSA